MKYMGHKGRILQEISDQVARFTRDANTLCDAFCGSAAVAWDLAEKFDKPILAGDLQSFATARAAAIVTRTEPIADFEFVDRWFARARILIAEATAGHRIPPSPPPELKGQVLAPRNAILRSRHYVATTLTRILRRTEKPWPITLAYGGYYFSIDQALGLDALRSTLPKDRPLRAVALSALIGAASKCSASPGHTAQPLGIKRDSLPHVIDAWNRSIFDSVRNEIEDIAPRHARVQGGTEVGPWEQLLNRLAPGDVAFCDPPYSDVQYSRFYHVLETLSRGKLVEVSGSGRNPPFSERPASDFSRKSKAKDEVDKLISAAAEREIRLIITFPVSVQSNGLMAYTFVRKARQYFSKVDDNQVTSVFSSLGGNGEVGSRPAREKRVERIICCYD